MTLSTKASEQQIEAYFYTFTKAQSEARKVDADPTSQAYFDAMTRALGDLGWTVSRAAPYRHAPGNRPIAPLTALVDAFLQILVSALPLAIDVKAVNGWLEAAERALADPPLEVERQLDAWWTGTQAGRARVMTVGPLADILGVPWLGVLHCRLRLEGKSWRALIEPSANFGLSAAPVVMSLNWIAYGLIEDDLKAALAADLKAQIAKARLDLGEDCLEAVS